MKKINFIGKVVGPIGKHVKIKDEYKETDGQPEVKQKIRKLQMSAATKSRKEASSVDNLEEATAIITNPTHFAVALKNFKS